MRRSLLQIIDTMLSIIVSNRFHLPFCAQTGHIDYLVAVK